MNNISRNGIQVVLNVYDLHENNEFLYSIGLGLYHSGVQIDGKEYTFASGSGIFDHTPRNAPGAKLRESLNLGIFRGSSKDIETILHELQPSFQGSDYDLLNRNCNSFSEKFVERLLNQRIPGYVNRMAIIGSYFSCLLPPSTTGQAPVQDSPSRSSSFQNSYRQISGSSQHSNSKQISQSFHPFQGKGNKLGGT